MTACQNFIYRREEKKEAISRSFLSIKSGVDHNLRSSFAWQIKQNAIYFNEVNKLNLKNIPAAGGLTEQSKCCSS